MGKAGMPPYTSAPPVSVNNHAVLRFRERAGAWLAKEGLSDDDAVRRRIAWRVKEAMDNGLSQRLYDEKDKRFFRLVDISDPGFGTAYAIQADKGDDAVITVLTEEMKTTNFTPTVLFGGKPRWHAGDGEPITAGQGLRTSLRGKLSGVVPVTKVPTLPPPAPTPVPVRSMNEHAIEFIAEHGLPPPGCEDIEAAVVAPPPPAIDEERLVEVLEDGKERFLHFKTRETASSAIARLKVEGKAYAVWKRVRVKVTVSVEEE